VRVGDVGDARDLREAGRGAAAGAELREEGRRAEPPRVRRPRRARGLGEGVAGVAVDGGHVAVPIAVRRREAARVDVVGERRVAARRLREAGGVDAAEDGDVRRVRVWKRRRFEEQDRVGVPRPDGRGHPCVQRLEDAPVRGARLQERRVLEEVAVERLVHQIVAEDALDARERLRDDGPVRDERVGDTRGVGEDFAPARRDLGGPTIHGEVAREALVRVREARRRVRRKVVGRDGRALADQTAELREPKREHECRR